MKTEDLLELQSSNDGRVMTDKSVVYRADDYDAYDTDSYEQGDFSVTLSALAQEWTIQDEVDDAIPVDMVFILDLSNSMNNTGTVKWQKQCTSTQLHCKGNYGQKLQEPYRSGGFLQHSNWKFFL